MKPIPPQGATSVMGVLNLAPDSFSDGSRFAATNGRFDVAAAIAAACAMEADGAAVLDVGAVSTRPGATPVTPEEEWARLAPTLAALRQAVTIPLSLDTTSSLVLRRALEVGVDMLNDVSALGDDPETAAVAAEAGIPVVLMHRRGTPRTMQQDPRYDDAPREVWEELLVAVARAEDHGIPANRLVLDPGIGFGKRLHDNLALLADLPAFVRRARALGARTVVGCSRKAFLGTLTGRPVGEREHATTATTVLCAQAGVDFVRVHDARAAADALAVVRALTPPASTARGS